MEKNFDVILKQYARPSKHTVKKMHNISTQNILKSLEMGRISNVEPKKKIYKKFKLRIKHKKA